MRKICVVISARASYARIKTMLENIEQNENLSLEIILIGSSILEKYGDISASVQAKFKNVFKITLLSANTEKTRHSHGRL